MTIRSHLPHHHLSHHNIKITHRHTSRHTFRHNTIRRQSRPPIPPILSRFTRKFNIQPRRRHTHHRHLNRQPTRRRKVNRVTVRPHRLRRHSRNKMKGTTKRVRTTRIRLTTRLNRRPNLPTFNIPKTNTVTSTITTRSRRVNLQPHNRGNKRHTRRSIGTTVELRQTTSRNRSLIHHNRTTTIKHNPHNTQIKTRRINISTIVSSNSLTTRFQQGTINLVTHQHRHNIDLRSTLSRVNQPHNHQSTLLINTKTRFKIRPRVLTTHTVRRLNVSRRTNIKPSFLRGRHLTPTNIARSSIQNVTIPITRNTHNPYHRPTTLNRLNVKATRQVKRNSNKQNHMLSSPSQQKTLILFVNRHRRLIPTHNRHQNRVQRLTKGILISRRSTRSP